MERKYLSRQEISEVLGISLSSVARGWKDKSPPFDKGIKIGRRVLFPVSSFVPLYVEHRSTRDIDEQ